MVGSREKAICSWRGRLGVAAFARSGPSRTADWTDCFLGTSGQHLDLCPVVLLSAAQFPLKHQRVALEGPPKPQLSRDEALHQRVTLEGPPELQLSQDESLASFQPTLLCACSPRVGAQGPMHVRWAQHHLPSYTSMPSLQPSKLQIRLLLHTSLWPIRASAFILRPGTLRIRWRCPEVTLKDWSPKGNVQFVSCLGMLATPSEVCLLCKGGWAGKQQNKIETRTPSCLEDSARLLGVFWAKVEKEKETHRSQSSWGSGIVIVAR